MFESSASSKPKVVRYANAGSHVKGFITIASAISGVRVWFTATSTSEVTGHDRN